MCWVVCPECSVFLLSRHSLQGRSLIVVKVGCNPLDLWHIILTGTQGLWNSIRGQNASKKLHICIKGLRIYVSRLIKFSLKPSRSDVQNLCPVESAEKAVPPNRLDCMEAIAMPTALAPSSPGQRRAKLDMSGIPYWHFFHMAFFCTLKSKYRVTLSLCIVLGHIGLSTADT